MSRSTFTRKALIMIIGAAWLISIAIEAVLCQAALAESSLRCPTFTPQVLPVSQPRYDDARARAVFDGIKMAVKTRPYRVLFLGDSLTKGFNWSVWREHMAPRGLFNAGVGGDTTEELRWRLEHGNLDG